MKARLITLKNGRQDLAFPILGTRTAIGREPDNAIQLSDPEASKHHAMIHTLPGGWEIEDRGSRNGTFVNGKQIQRTALRNNDQLRIGTTDLLFETIADNERWVASVVIDLSTNIGAKTICAPQPKREA